MGYESLENKHHISAELDIAIEIEQEISDLLVDGETCDSDQVKRCYSEAKEISQLLTEEEKLILGGIGKKLWQDRVAIYPFPAMSAEYYPEMGDDIAEYDRRLHRILTPDRLQIAIEIMAEVDLPRIQKPLAA